MAIQVADNFQYLGQKPLDARIKYATVADMAAVAASSLYDGIMAYVVATEKNYQWKSTNPVDETLGKWREFQSGGASADGKAESSAIAPVFDDTATYAAGDRVTYEDELYVFNTDHTGAWAAADADKSDVDSEIPDKLTSQQMQEIKDAFVIDAPRNGYPVLFDETGAEHFVGWYKYADGTKQPVYLKTFVNVPCPNKTMTQTPHGISNLGNLISVDAVRWDADGNNYALIPSVHDSSASYQLRLFVTSSNIEIEARGFDFSNSKATVTLRYTKTTDTPQ